jgi:peptidoglycan hydrolase-like protein with peptidoglycan-binding domain
MATRKRKLPDKRKSARKEPGFAVLAAKASMRLVARNPGVVMCTLGFVVVLGCVTANAFWYQPGRHPSPFLRTRDPRDFTAMLGFNTSTAIKPHPDDVTTFLIQRQDVSTPSAVAKADTPAPVAQNTASVPAQAPLVDNSAVDNSTDRQTILSIQTQLARLGLYDGPFNGVRDARTNAAIAAYQQRIGLSTDNAQSDDLLSVLAADHSAPATPAVTSVHPLERPAMVNMSRDDGIDPVAAAIRNAERGAATPSATKISANAATPVPRVGVGASNRASDASVVPGPSLIMDVQRGLINVSYTGIKVDGVLGEKTRAAIRHFQRHYRLSETGEPNMAVLQTLKSIGAL